MKVERSITSTPRALVEAILDPRLLVDLDMAEWERVLSCARRNAVLAYLAQRTVSAGVIDKLPEIPRTSLRSAMTAAARLAQLAQWELDRLRRVLQPAQIPVIALKGAAYVLRGMPHAATRLFSDVDIMVPAERIDDAERALLVAGWRGTLLDAYDQSYYRRWSHEIPPLQYPGRLLAVDVHHTICPPVSRLRPDPALFWANAEPSTTPGIRLLCPADSVLHAAVHLFFDSDFDSRFRDLIDLHELLTGFGGPDEFWSDLVAEARRQGLVRPLYYAFATLARVLRTPIPERARRDVLLFKPVGPVDAWMTGTLESVLTPADPERWPPAHRGRLWLLYVRSHWLRMPPHLLLPHLIRKSVRRSQPGAVDG
jgi:hypothetical protein